MCSLPVETANIPSTTYNTSTIQIYTMAHHDSTETAETKRNFINIYIRIYDVYTGAQAAGCSVLSLRLADPTSYKRARPDLISKYYMDHRSTDSKFCCYHVEFLKFELEISEKRYDACIRYIPRVNKSIEQNNLYMKTFPKRRNSVRRRRRPYNEINLLSFQ